MKNRNYILDCEIVHRIHGRIRIKSKSLKYLGIYKKEVEEQLKQVHYIQSVEISSITGTIVIYFDDFSLLEENLISLLQNTLNVYLVEIYKNEKKIKSDKYVIERKLQEESPKEIMQKILTSLILLVLPGPKKRTGLGYLFNYKILSTISLTFPVIKNGLQSLVQNKRPNADTLSSTAIISSLLLGNEKTALTIMILERIAELLTVYTIKKTRGVIKDMLSVGESYVWKQIDNGVVKKVSIDEIVKGDSVLVQTGEKISVDGVIERGSAVIDQSSITGEYMPVTKKTGEEVFAGTIIKSGSITVKAEKVGDERTVSRIIKLVEDASFNKADIQSYADTFSAQLIPLNFLLAGIVYFSTRNVQKALSMLVIDYSCGIRLSTATAFSAAINTAAKNGILIKGSNYLEELSKSDTVIFDKTGTITVGKPVLTDFKVYGNHAENELLQLAASVENHSEHPLAEAIVKGAKDKNIELKKYDKFRALPGYGIRATIDGKEIQIGNKKLMDNKKIDITISDKDYDVLSNQGKTPMYMSIDNELVGLIAVADVIKPTSKEAIDKLHKLGVKAIMLTGDNQKTAEYIAKQVGINTVVSEVLPYQKSEEVKKLQEKDEFVAMVGDGINDSPALAQANVGIAIGSGTDVAIESADIILIRNDLRDVANAIALSKATITNIKENLFWAFFYNVLGIPVAAGILYAFFNGPKLDPMIAAFAMSFSSVSVLLNALRLKLFKVK